MREAGISVIGRVICETEAGPLEHHLVDWPDAGEHQGFGQDFGQDCGTREP